MNNIAPVTLFVYNRPWHTQEVIKALQSNELAEQSDLIIYSDGPKNEESTANVREVRDLIKTVKGFRSVTVVERDKNWGLARNVINGVSEIVNKYGKIIVLEDDIITSQCFLVFMNQALNRFGENNEFMSISGYLYPAELPSDYELELIKFYRGSSWGWGTWKKEWNLIDFDLERIFQRYELKEIKKISKGGEDLYRMLINQRKEKINSWAIRFALAHTLHKKYALFPYKSYATNIGHDSSGTHCVTDDKWSVPLSGRNISDWTEPTISPIINNAFLKVLNKPMKDKIKHKILRILGK